jgi:hypothetical protein
MRLATPTERGKRHEISREIGLVALDQGNSFTLRQVYRLPTSQMMLDLLKNTIPIIFGLKKSSLRKTKILQRQSKNPATIYQNYWHF